MVLRAAIRLSVLLFTLAACTSIPVPVRDTVETPAPEISEPLLLPPATLDKPKVQPEKALETAPITVKPQPTPVPLNSKLKQQAEQSLQQRHWQQAILFAERGLRIDRREPFFYWVLSAAYQQLSEVQQSIDFARQGLRYLYGDSWLKTQLMSLAEQ